jgi:hypothetical protein
MHSETNETAADQLLPGREVDRRYGITPRTRNRWKNDPKMAFGPPVVINGREYYRVSDLLKFEQGRVQHAAPRAA